MAGSHDSPDCDGGLAVPGRRVPGQGLVLGQGGGLPGQKKLGARGEAFEVLAGELGERGERLQLPGPEARTHLLVVVHVHAQRTQKKRESKNDVLK